MSKSIFKSDYEIQSTAGKWRAVTHSPVFIFLKILSFFILQQDKRGKSVGGQDTKD